MEIVDTVYLVAYFRPDDPLHSEAVMVVENLGGGRVVSQAALVELDLLMKSRGLTPLERAKTWSVLSKAIDVDVVEPITPMDLLVSSRLSGRYAMDYFDSIIAAQCITRNAVPLTTDESIKNAVSKAEEVISELRKAGLL